MTEQYVSLSAEKFVCGSRSPVDFFQGVGPGEYKAFARQGDLFDRTIIDSIVHSDAPEIHIRKADLPVYVSYGIAVCKRILCVTAAHEEKDFALACRIAELLFLSLKNNGANPLLGSQLTEVSHLLASLTAHRQALRLFLSDMAVIDDPIARHSVATAILAMALVRGMGWQSEQNIRVIGAGALVHDLSLIRYPEVYRIPRTQWSEYAEEAYRTHPQSGAAMIMGRKMFDDERVYRIVADHQELPDGSGFPNGLHIKRIFPMALPVIMADRLADRILNPAHGFQNQDFSTVLAFMLEQDSAFYPKDYWDSASVVLKWITE